MRLASSILVRAAIAGIAAVITLAAAAQGYPTRAVRIITAQAPGGPSDAAVRGIAEVLSASLGHPFVVENRQGAEGLIAGEACARATPDGYTLCLVDSFATFLVPALREKLNYDPVKDFSPVIHVGFLPSGLWVNSSVPAKNPEELFALAKSNPRVVNMANWGRASSSYLLSQYLGRKGVPFTDVPYKSATASWQGLVAGEVQAGMYAVRAGMRQGSRVRLLAVNSDVRLPETPDTPTFAELGLPSAITWFMLQAPAGTPAEITGTLNAVLREKLYNNPEARTRILTGNGMYSYGPAGAQQEELRAYLKSQEKMYADFIKAAGVTKE